MDITVPEEFVRDLVRGAYAFGPYLGGSSDVSYNQPENCLRRLCQKTGVTKELEEHFVRIVRGEKASLKIEC